MKSWLISSSDIKRFGHSATSFADDSFVIIGGADEKGQIVTKIEIFRSGITPSNIEFMVTRSTNLGTDRCEE